jgi:hypothetical protein
MARTAKPVGCSRCQARNRFRFGGTGQRYRSRHWQRPRQECQYPERSGCAHIPRWPGRSPRLVAGVDRDRDRGRKAARQCCYQLAQRRQAACRPADDDQITRFHGLATTGPQPGKPVISLTQQGICYDARDRAPSRCSYGGDYASQSRAIRCARVSSSGPALARHRRRSGSISVSA